MLSHERQAVILEKLSTEGRVLSAELSQALAVSEDTVRRDLRALAEAGLLVKVHGGAIPRSTTKLQFAERTQESQAEKRAIAREAVRLIQPGMVVFFDAGTTALEAARSVAPEVAFTAVTHSPLAAAALCELPGAEVVLIGGRMLKRGQLAVGPETVAGYRRMRANLCFLGICCVHADSGITDPSYDETLVKQAMIESASEVVVVAGGDKLGKVSNFVVAPAASVDRLITDTTAPEPAVAALRAAGIDVTIVDG
ncbi:MAG TPA: DeoR/GlpR family DNA-binding transcription regulator [Opitutaceae bacterium]